MAFFSAANQYVLCVMTATILGCSLHSANVYFNILNQTITNVFRSSDYQCYIYHPIDVVSLYTTTTSTVAPTTKTPKPTVTTRGSSDKTDQYREISASAQVKTTQVLCYITLVVVSRRLCLCNE